MSPSSPPYLQIQLLSDFDLLLKGKKCAAIEKPRQKALLAYLAYNQGKNQARSHLAFSFWPDSEEGQAHTNLRNLLHGIRQALPSIDRFLQVDKQSIGLCEDSECIVDAVQLKNALSSGAYEKAVEMYRGHLLPKSHDEWLEPERERLRLNIDTALSKLVETYRKAGNLCQAIHFSKIRIQHESLSDLSRQTHIELLAESGDKAAALQAYQSYEKHLAAELSIAPGNEIQSLRDKIAASSNQERSPCLAPADTNTPTPIANRSIAVLPFDTRSQIKSDRYFADGIQDDLITRISRIQGFDIISRTSTREYRDTTKSLKQVARELGVATLIEGGVQRSGNQLRINVQLIDAQTGFHLWADNYTRPITAQSIFELQTEITAAITTELRGVLLPKTSKTQNRVPTNNLKALESYFYGRASSALNSSDSLAKAITHYKRAIELDTSFAEAHAYLALAYLGQIHASGKSVEEQVAVAQSHIAKALQIDNSLSNAHAAMGHLKYHETDYVSTERSYEKAIELDPNNALAFHLYAISKHYKSGDLDTALQLIQKATELDPRQSAPRTEQASILMSLGRPQEAKEILEKIIEDDPSNVLAINRLGTLYDASLNRYHQAIRLYRRAYAFDPSNQDLSSTIAWTYLKLGLEDQFISWSERDLAISPASYKVNFLKGHLHEFKGQKQEALASFSALKKTDLAYDWTVYKIAAAAVDSGNPEKALEEFILAYPWITAPDVAINQKNCIQLMEYAYLLHLNDRQGEVQALGKRLIEFLPQGTRLSQIGYQYFDSHLYIALGDKPRAYQAIQEYFDQGGCSSYFATEVFTQSLHQEEEFKRLLALNEQRLAHQRQTLLAWEAKGDLAPIPDLPLSIGR